MNTLRAEKLIDDLIRKNPTIEVDSLNPKWAVEHCLKSCTDPDIKKELEHLLANPKPHSPLN